MCISRRVRHQKNFHLQETNITRANWYHTHVRVAMVCVCHRLVSKLARWSRYGAATDPFASPKRFISRSLTDTNSQKIKALRLDQCWLYGSPHLRSLGGEKLESAFVRQMSEQRIQALRVYTSKYMVYVIFVICTLSSCVETPTSVVNRSSWRISITEGLVQEYYPPN